MSRRKHILFISHEGSFTGAPILLLNLISLVHAKGEFDISILCVRDGILRKDLVKYGHCTFLKNEDMYRESTFSRKWSNKFGFVWRILINIFTWVQADIVFNNTIGNGKVLRFYCRFKKLPIISYVHELEGSIRHAERQGEAQLTFDLSDKILSPSIYNTEVLNRTFRVPQARIEVLRYLIRTQLDNQEQDELTLRKAYAKEQWCKRFGIDKTKLLILGMGTFDKRKAVDYFIQAAQHLSEKDIHFFWIGMAKEPDFLHEMEEYVTRNGINNFHYIGPMPHDLHNYLPFDILFLSSREDPYPLVVLEAASVQIPTICFSRSGGIIDFVTKETGWIIEDFNPKHAAQIIASSTENEILSKGALAQQKVQAWHFDEHAIYKSFISHLNLK